MDTDKLQSGGYDSGLGDEVGQDLDGCWAPPPSTAPSPEPPRSSENFTPYEFHPDLGPFVLRVKSSSEFNATPDKRPGEDGRETALFIPTPLETIYELPSTADERLYTALSNAGKRFHDTIYKQIRKYRNRRQRLRPNLIKLRPRAELKRSKDISYMSAEDVSERNVRYISVQDISKRFNSLQV